jgi:hypothetical protein
MPDTIPTFNTWGDVAKVTLKTAGPLQPDPRVMPNNSSNKIKFGIRDNNFFII